MIIRQGLKSTCGRWEITTTSRGPTLIDWNHTANEYYAPAVAELRTFASRLESYEQPPNPEDA